MVLLKIQVKFDIQMKNKDFKYTFKYSITILTYSMTKKLEGYNITAVRLPTFFVDNNGVTVAWVLF